MHWSFSLGRVFGSDLRVHVTFFLLLAWVFLGAWSVDGPQAGLRNVVFVLALFACVVAHEFGHALTARTFGIKTPDVTLYPFGGMARLERMPENPRQEILVALAGPAVNVVIWGLLVLLGVTPSMSLVIDPAMDASGIMGQIATANLFLALFNLVPAFPMDGGRVLRAVLALSMDRVRATRAAATTGQVLAVLLGFLGLSSGNIVLALIAVFVFFAAGAESQEVAMRSIARKFRARDAMITSFEKLTPQDSLATAAASLLRTTQHEFPVVEPDGTLHGILTRAALFQALAADAPRTSSVTEHTETNITCLPLEAPLDQVLQALHDGSPAVAVCDAKQHLIGYITSENVGELMVLSGR